MKKITSFALIFSLFILLSVSAFASGYDYVIDNCGVLSYEELQSLESQAEEISAVYGIDTVVRFVNSLSGLEISEYADRLWYQEQRNESCSMLLVSLTEHEYYFYNCGTASKALTDYGVSYIEDRFVSQLSAGNWYKAAGIYLTYCAEFYKEYFNNGQAYDINNKPSLQTGLLTVFANTGIGLLLAGLPLRKQKKSMESVAKKQNANEYEIRPGLVLTRKNDVFAGRHVTHIPIPKPAPSSSSHSGGGATIHMSSSGHSFSGHGGKF